MSGAVSRMRLGLIWGLAAGFVLLMAGDHAQTATNPANIGIDPFEILDLQVRANVIVVLDSSGSMREFTGASGLVDGIGAGEFVGDDPNSKLAIAKSALKKIVEQNKDRVNFQFGRYDQVVANTVLDGNDTYYYVTTDSDAANMEVNSTGDGNTGIDIKRKKGGGLTGDDFTVNGTPYYYLRAHRFWNGETINLPSNGTNDGNIATGTVTKTNPATVTLVNNAGTASAKFTLAGPNFNRGTGASCSGFASLVPLAPCTTSGQMQIDNILPYLDKEVEYGSDGSIVMSGGQPTDTKGVRAVGGTPIIGALDDINNNFWSGGLAYWTPIALKPVQSRPKTLVVFVTDGDDQCNTNPYTGGGTSTTGKADTDYDFDFNARNAAKKAQTLFQPKKGSLNANGTYTDPVEGPTSSVETFFIAFGGATGIQRSNWIAWAGSGLNEAAAGFNWNLASSASKPLVDANDAVIQAKRNACITCRDAVLATDATQLEKAIQDAIDRGIGSGEFSSQSQGSVTDSVFEYDALSTATGGPFDPTDGRNRFGTTFPITVRSTFTMPGFNGQLKAFDSTSTQRWDAGALLKTNVLDVVNTGGPYSFAELHGGVATAPKFIPASTAKLRRRIFTTSGNGVALSTYPLWPPTTTGSTAVAPSDTTNYPVGALDGSATAPAGLALGGLTFAQLQTEFQACDGSVPANIPADCGNSNKDKAALKEAREILLAYTAGAVVVIDATSGKPLRKPATKELQYSARSWLLAESTIATPAFVGAPDEVVTQAHGNEYLVYRDGHRGVNNELVSVNAVESGLGVRNPDRGTPDPQDTTGEVEAVMTVVYVAANDMLHAFRAGPQACTSSAACPPSGKEGGGEELWGYVPYDQLWKLKLKRSNPQSRSTPTFMMSNSVRFGDVFVPGDYTGPDNKPYTGKWRTMMFVGRGAGGKFMSGLDITGPGPFTRKALETRLPDVVWNRGNPDTIEGLPTGTSLGTAVRNAAMVTKFSGMGETWSVPALVPVNTATADTDGKEWVLWMGSGFSDVDGQGKSLYTIDVLTGDILRSVDVGTASSNPRTNFINANVVGFVPFKLDKGQRKEPFNAADGPATAAIVGDLHGRLFRALATKLDEATALKDYGTDQPIGVAVTALYLNTDGSGKKPHIFGNTGNDMRVAFSKTQVVTTPPFLMFGVRDDGASITELFDTLGTTGTIDFPERFRGTTQPLVFIGPLPDENLVFFVGTQFNPAGVASSSDPCISSFDSILFAVKAVSGSAAFDLSAAGDDRSAIWRGQKVQNITGRGGVVVLDTGLNAGGAPPPPPPPKQQPISALPSVLTGTTKYGSPVCKW